MRPPTRLGQRGGFLWRRGRVFEVLDRNRSDVALARDVFEFGRDFGWVQVDKGNGVGFEQLEVNW